MGRIRRPCLPGVAFHLTQRLQNGAHLLTPRLRWQLLHLLRRHTLRSDARLLAYVFMTNHLHIVVVQGEQPLSRLMQPYLLAASLAIHAAYGTSGHAFQSRYRDRICRDADHVRFAIAYAHANPVRAGLCTHPGEYPWSSHRIYERARQQRYRPRVDLACGLEVFAPGGCVREAASCYARTLDDVLRSGAEHPLQPQGSDAQSGRNRIRSDEAVEDRAVQLAAIARRVLDELAPHLVLGNVQTRFGSRRHTVLRRAIAREAVRRGFRHREIAGLLRVSEATISRLLTR